MRDAIRIIIGVILLLVIEYLGMIYGVWPKAPSTRGSYFSWWFCGGR